MLKHVARTVSATHVQTRQFANSRDAQHRCKSVPIQDDTVVMTDAQSPARFPRYRVLTGVDDAAFCHRVSDALDLGYELYGGPAVTFNGSDVIVAQALIWTSAAPRPRTADEA